MKNIFYLLAITLIAVNLTGCDNPQPEASTDVTPKQTETVVTPEIEETKIIETIKYEYNRESGELISLNDNEVIYEVTDPTLTALQVLGLEGDKLIIWETGYDNSPGPGGEYDVWFEEGAAKGIQYLDLSTSDSELQPYTVPESKKQEAKKQLEEFTEQIQ